MAGTLFEKRLDDNLINVKQESQDAAKDKKQDSPSKASKKQSKKEEKNNGS